MGIFRPSTVEEAQQAAERNAGSIVQELWQGKEYTVNVFVDA
ncbi:MAG TPA: hypothetical protein VHD62_16880 [Opitutaceae bacterium]|nr:hypothetical protein [Opitutaceae bacterium]